LYERKRIRVGSGISGLMIEHSYLLDNYCLVRSY
jgi:hypothetical protein